MHVFPVPVPCTLYSLSRNWYVSHIFESPAPCVHCVHRVQGAGCRVQGAGCRVQGAGCRVQGGVKGVYMCTERLCSNGEVGDL